MTPQDASATHAPPPRNPKNVPDTVSSLASDAALAGHPAGLRRTFAIISHPDAGKTTLTEKLLLFGGAIQVAGAVKARGEARRARSDWMKIEQQRGISVTTSVMHFEYGGAVFNLLDTPGHEDFSEDTYRTLTAVDSAVMVIDAAKGIEAQTRKLFEVCRLRDMPIITFVNKIDREAKDPFELLDEIASTLALDVAPMTWPTGIGLGLQGHATTSPAAACWCSTATDRSRIGERDRELRDRRTSELAEEVELVRVGYPAFDLESYRDGHLTPVFFGSAPTTISASTRAARRAGRLGAAAAAAAGRAARRSSRPSPRSRASCSRSRPTWTPTTATASPSCGCARGKFRRGMKLTQIGHRQDRSSVNSPILFFAREREIVDEAVAGRHHRHSQPRRAARRRHADRGRDDQDSPASPTSRRKSCAACGSRTR